MSFNALIKRVHPDAIIPIYHSNHAAAFDFVTIEDTKVHPGALAKIRTGLIIQAPEGYYLQISARSSLAFKKGLILSNGVGVIDRDYSGPQDEILIAVYNFSTNVTLIQKGERLAQGIFLPTKHINWIETEEISEINRGGFGSTGIRHI